MSRSETLTVEIERFLPICILRKTRRPANTKSANKKTVLIYCSDELKELFRKDSLLKGGALLILIVDYGSII